MSNDTDSRQSFAKRGITLRDVDWPVVVGIAAMHVGCLMALLPVFFSWSGLIVAGLLLWITGGLGITLCYHRLLTHHSFKTPRWFQCILTLFGCLAWQGGPIQWVGVHRIHHRHSDEPEDPHTPKHGFAWAHIFWCMHKQPQGQCATDAAKDLERDPFMRLLNRFFWVPQLLLVPLVYFAGEYFAGAGLSWLVWGVCARTVVLYHGTWFVNSATHTWGYRNFDTPDQSTNLWWVALLSFGEGWHNNHHAQQRSAAHGMRWFEFDLTYCQIRLLALAGLAKNVVHPQRITGENRPAGQPQQDTLPTPLTTRSQAQS